MQAHVQVQQHSLPGYRPAVPGSLFSECGVRTVARLRTKSQAVSPCACMASPHALGRANARRRYTLYLL